eukprot:scaffold4868_cov416-Prasinococcus_capsulatus_cf.AAC.13
MAFSVALKVRVAVTYFTLNTSNTQHISVSYRRRVSLDVHSQTVSSCTTTTCSDGPSRPRVVHDGSVRRWCNVPIGPSPFPGGAHQDRPAIGSFGFSMVRSEVKPYNGTNESVQAARLLLVGPDRRTRRVSSR